MSQYYFPIDEYYTILDILANNLEEAKKFYSSKKYIKDEVAIGVQFNQGGKEYTYNVPDPIKAQALNIIYFALRVDTLNSGTAKPAIRKIPIKDFIRNLFEGVEFKANTSMVKPSSIIPVKKLNFDFLKDIQKINAPVANHEKMDIFASIVCEFEALFKKEDTVFIDSVKLSAHSNTLTKKDGNSIMKNSTNSTSIMDQIGNKMKGVFAMSMTGGFATLIGSDYYVNNDGELSVVTDFVMKDFTMDGYIMPVASSAVKIGDVIVVNQKTGIVTKSKGSEISYISDSGEIKTFKPVKQMPMMDAFVLTVMNPFGAMPQGPTDGNPMGMGAMNPMMLMMMSKGDSGSDDNSMFKMMAMSQMMGAGGFNPFAPQQPSDNK